MCRKVICFALAVLCVVSMLLPVAALDEVKINSVSKAAGTLHDCESSCDGVHEFVHLRTHPMALAFEPHIDAEINALRANATRAITCNHENVNLYDDTSSGVKTAVCLDCLTALENPSTLSVKAVIQTNAEIRAGCNHVWSAWGYYNNYDHVRFCSVCGYHEMMPHTIVEANCTVSQHCIVCNAADSSWPTAYGHLMSNVFCMDLYLSTGTYNHEYRCVRQGEYGYSCDYVASRTPCDMGATYWDAEFLGMHECYNVCPGCWATGEIWYEDCPIAVYGSGHCVKCMNPNPFNG